MIQSITALSSPMGGISYFELSFVEQLTCLACLSRCSSNPQRRKRPPAFNSIPNSSFQVSVQAYVHEDKTAFQYMVITITSTNTKGWSLKCFLSLSSISFHNNNSGFLLNMKTHICWHFFLCFLNIMSIYR